MRDMTAVDTIMIHTAATPANWRNGQTTKEKVAEVTRWHVEERGWAGNGYAWLIDRDGTEEIGRDLDGDGDPWEEITAGAKGFNTNTIHICLFGGKGSSANDAFSDNYTAAQDAILRSRIDKLRRAFPSIKYVIGHNKVAAKACPGFQVRPWYDREQPRTVSGSKTLRGAVVGGAATVGTGVTAVGALEGDAQLMVIAFAGVALLAVLYMARERIRAWARGVR